MISSSSMPLIAVIALATGFANTVTATTTQSDETPWLSAPGWLLDDPENHEDVRRFVQEYWDGLWEETPMILERLEELGVASSFRNPLPYDFAMVYIPWERVFERLYAHRLSLDSSSEQRYDLWDLMNDDVKVRNEFRDFILTNKLCPTLVDDMGVFFEHYALVSDALAGGAIAVVDAADFDGGLLESTALRVIEVEPYIPNDSPTEPTAGVAANIEAFKCRLRWWARASLLPCMKANGLWNADPTISTTGGCRDDAFDCDDFTDAMLRWLEQHMGLLDLQRCRRFIFRWRCPPEVAFQGHWMPIIVKGDRRFLVDPYSGEVDGPFEDSPAGLELMAKKGLSRIGVECEHVEWERIPDLLVLDSSYAPREPRPLWNKCPGSVRRFCAALRACCGKIPVVTPPCVPSPLGTSDDQLRITPCNIGDYSRSFDPPLEDPGCNNIPPNE